MHAFLPLIEQVLMNAIMSKKAPLMRKNKYGLGLMALSAILFLVALIFTCLAGYGWLLTEFDQPTAAIITAGFILGFSILSALTGVSLSRRRPPEPVVPTDEITEIMSNLTELVGDELLDTIRENPKTAILLAGAAGMVAGEQLN